MLKGPEECREKKHYAFLSWLFLLSYSVTSGKLITMSSSVQSLSHVRLFGTPWTGACQASLSITHSWGLPEVMSIESVTPSNHLILCHLLLRPSTFSSIRVFPNESALQIRWPKYWSFSFSISSSNQYSGLISFQFSSVQSLSCVRLCATP